jgi:hypothetical protein
VIARRNSKSAPTACIRPPRGATALAIATSSPMLGKRARDRAAIRQLVRAKRLVEKPIAPRSIASPTRRAIVLRSASVACSSTARSPIT